MARRKRKKIFPCGHRGQGKECQRCKQEAKAAHEAAGIVAQRRLKKVQWEASFEHDGINLRGLPHEDYNAYASNKRQVS